MQRVLSGIQPTGDIHIGNYLGALKNWVKIGNQLGKNALYCVVDYHAITIAHDEDTLAQRTVEGALVNMAVGLDPNRVTLFVQSHVPEHTELTWVLTNRTPVGDLERMTQYKDKVAQHHSALAGLLQYPMLMAADILLYKADTVPVGDDQTQHLELAREAARRFNGRFGFTFPEPQAFIDRNAARVRGLDNAGKMSKSKGNTIGVLEDFNSIWEKIRVAPTDPARVRRQDPGNPFICLIHHYHTLFSERPTVEMVEVECARAGIGCVECKKFLMTGLRRELEPVQERAAYLHGHLNEVTDALVEGAAQARAIASATMQEVRDRIGLLPVSARVEDRVLYPKPERRAGGEDEAQEEEAPAGA
ncbi:MAG TPA: tryptophan--tRNA ligase [Deinococcales bacterium]|nr:tryptophan--tRNA ligase [Deinococcales bacterium]